MRTTDFLQMSHAQCAMKAADMAWEIITITAERDALMQENKRLWEVLNRARDALAMPCDRWNKTQHMIVTGTITAIDEAIATVKEK